MVALGAKCLEPEAASRLFRLWNPRESHGVMARLEERAIDCGDLGTLDWPEIPAIEAVGDVGGQHEVFVVVQMPTLSPYRQEPTVGIVAYSFCNALSIDEES